MTSRPRLALALFLPLLAACGAASHPPPPGMFAKRSASAAASPAAEVIARSGSKADAEGLLGDNGMAPPPPPAPPSEKLAQNDHAAPRAHANPGARPVEAQAPIVIYTATFSMAAFQVEQGLRAIDAIARDLGGFLVRRDDAAITFRVPASRFDEAVARVERAGDVVKRNVVAEDVTEEFLDLGVRLRNARAMRDRLEQLLAKAANVNDSLAIERELGRVAGEIERIEGRLKFLRDRAAFSTITVTFARKHAEDRVSPSVKLPFPWLQNLGLGRLLSL